MHPTECVAHAVTRPSVHVSCPLVPLLPASGLAGEGAEGAAATVGPGAHVGAGTRRQGQWEFQPCVRPEAAGALSPAYF